MTYGQAALITTTFAPIAGAIAIFVAGESRARARTLIGVSTAALTAIGAATVALGVGDGRAAVRVGLELFGIGLALRADALGSLLAVVASVLWLLTTVYAEGYLARARDKARFFGFFALCVGSAVGIALSANLLTLFVFYEVLTVATYPLVVHSGSSKALAGGRTYLAYALIGGVLLALGIVWLASLGGLGDFADGSGLSAELVAARRPELIAIFALLIAGFGVKAALFPAHGWLPAAMVAPAPVSALLHAVAVVKAGVFGIARVVLDVYGPETAARLGVLTPLAALAAVTVLFASVRALAFDDIKKRLAYSTVGQLSYIVLGLAIGTPVAAAAAVAHIAHHAVLKITMFFTAGVLAEELGITRVSEMRGVGRRMPLTMGAFSLSALGIIGVAPIAGFVTKWGLGAGALGAGMLWPVVVLGASGVLNAAYLMPMIGAAWFATPERDLPAPRQTVAYVREADARMVWPLVVTAVGGVALGVFAGAPWTAVSWAARVAAVPASAVVPWGGAPFGWDASGAAFAVLAVLVWAAAALSTWQAPRAEPVRYRALFVICALSSGALAVARDPAVFYACFGAMALSAYGLIVDDGTPRARAAGAVYLSITVVGEAALMTGLLIGASGAGSFAENLLASPWRDVGMLSLLVASGLKVSILGAGGWMPEAYSAAARGAGAALAGAVSSAGVLGVARFMPGGVVDLTGWGLALIVVGLASAFFGVAVGILQRDVRHALAYSSVSQFGLMWVCVGAGLTSAELWPAAVAACAIYLLHHGLAKAALFASDDLAAAGADRRTVLVACALPALSLAGLPLTSGAVAKVALKSVVAQAPGAVAHPLEALLPLTALGTTLLMAHVLVLVGSRGASNERYTGSSAPAVRTAATALLWIAVAGWAWVVGAEPVRSAARASFKIHYLWALVWPVVLGCGIGALAWAVLARTPGSTIPRVPPGDIWRPALDRYLVMWESYQRLLAAPSHAPATLGRRARAERWYGGLADAAARVERSLITWAVAGMMLAALGVLALTLVR